VKRQPVATLLLYAVLSFAAGAIVYIEALRASTDMAIALAIGEVDFHSTMLGLAISGGLVVMFGGPAAFLVIALVGAGGEEISETRRQARVALGIAILVGAVALAFQVLASR